MNFSKTKNSFLSPKDTKQPENCPSFSKPEIVGGFSIDGPFRIESDRRHLKYLYKNYDSEPVRYDLNEGIESVIRKAEKGSQKDKFNHLLRFILENIEDLKQNKGNPKFLPADVVTMLGSLQRVMGAPFNSSSPWRILGTRYKGSIYLIGERPETITTVNENQGFREGRNDEQSEELINPKTSIDTILSYGFKFERLLLSGKMLLNM